MPYKMSRMFPDSSPMCWRQCGDVGNLIYGQLNICSLGMEKSEVHLEWSVLPDIENYRLLHSYIPRHGIIESVNRTSPCPTQSGNNSHTDCS